MTIASNTKKSSTLNLIKGTLFNIVNKGKRSEYFIKTKNASMAVRGTLFYVEASDRETYLCVCKGKVEISNKKKKGVLKEFQDTHVTEGSEIKISRAPQAMWKMAREGFKDMGVDIGLMR